MENFPHSLVHFPSEFLEDLDQLTPAQLWQLERDPLSLPLRSKLKNFLGELRAIADQINDLVPPIICYYPEKHLRHVRGKKQHEITCLGTLLGNIHQQEQFTHGVDLGGGQGHLARTLAGQHHLPMFSLDQNPQLQQLGMARPDVCKDVTFVPMKFHHHHPELKQYFTKGACSVGLHTCGPLALSHFRGSLAAGTCWNINFGCCYLLLDAASEVNISHYAQQNGLPSSPFALSLATRSHAPSTWKNFLLNKQVKYYRYGLHLAFSTLLNLPYIRTVGDCPARTYYRPFSEYFFTKCRELAISLPIDFNDKKIEDFYYGAQIQATLRQMYLANSLRWRLGRVLEIYLLLDRALFLQEQQAEVSLGRFFREDISPRNIGIIWRPPRT